VPVLTPKLSSYWLGLVTPLYARIGEKLIDSVKHDTLVRDSLASNLFKVRPRGVKAAIARALHNEDKEFAETRWSDSLSSAGEVRTWGGVRFGSRIVDSRSVEVKAPLNLTFALIEQIGGRRGWYFGNWLWQIRGFLDLLVGGVGLRRGRRHPSQLALGDPVDFWRVEAYEPHHLLRLNAEMRLPGRAWLQFEAETVEENSTRLSQTAIFDPVGLSGLAYWYFLYPLHTLVFGGMLRNIKNLAEREFKS
jgi:hypothetical protein